MGIMTFRFCVSRHGFLFADRKFPEGKPFYLQPQISTSPTSLKALSGFEQQSCWNIPDFYFSNNGKKSFLPIRNDHNRQLPETRACARSLRPKTPHSIFPPIHHLHRNTNNEQQPKQYQTPKYSFAWQRQTIFSHPIFNIHALKRVWVHNNSGSHQSTTWWPYAEDSENSQHADAELSLRGWLAVRRYERGRLFGCMTQTLIKLLNCTHTVFRLALLFIIFYNVKWKVSCSRTGHCSVYWLNGWSPSQHNSQHTPAHIGVKHIKCDNYWQLLIMILCRCRVNIKIWAWDGANV